MTGASSFLPTFFYEEKSCGTSTKNNFSGLFLVENMKIKQQQNQIHFRI